MISMIYTLISEKYLREKDRRSMLPNDLLDGLPYALTAYDSAHRLIYANKKAEELLGFTEEEMMGLTNQEISKKFYGLSYEYESILYEISDSGDLGKDRVKTLHNRYGDRLTININIRRLKNGWILCQFTPAKEEQELKTIKLQTKTILDSLKAQVLMTDEQGRITVCNDAFAESVEMKSQDIIGWNINDFKNYLLFKKRSFYGEETTPQENAGVYEAHFITSQGNKKEVFVLQDFIRNLEGETIGMIETFFNSARFKKEQQVRQQHEKLVLLGQVATGIVHEIRNPLTAIKGFAEIIRLKGRGQDIKEYADYIDEEADRINKVVTDILNYADPHAPVFQEIRIHQIAEYLRLMTVSDTNFQRVMVRFDCSCDNKTFQADPDQIRQVLLHVMQNSLEAMTQVGNARLDIVTGFNKETEEVFISLTDNGHGMSEEEKMRAGMPFFTTKDKRMGLGLSVCYRIIKQHRGRICLESRPGKGTTITLYLPCTS